RTLMYTLCPYTTLFRSIERENIALGPMSLVLYSNHDIGGGISTYEVVHQISKQKMHADDRDRRFDVTLLINGLPIVQIELKQARDRKSTRLNSSHVSIS